MIGEPTREDAWFHDRDRELIANMRRGTSKSAVGEFQKPSAEAAYGGGRGPLAFISMMLETKKK